jgi:hypothetical protein
MDFRSEPRMRMPTNQPHIQIQPRTKPYATPKPGEGQPGLAV